FDFQQHDIGDEIEESCLYLVVKSRSFAACKAFFDSPLGAEMVAQAIITGRCRLEEIVAYEIRVFAKDLPNHCVIDEGFRQPVKVEPDIPFLEFDPMNRDGRIEMPQNSFHNIHR